MLWDPEVESPASIAVIGAGSVGIEAALYARFLGYNVDIYDTGRRPERRLVGIIVRSKPRLRNAQPHLAMRLFPPKKKAIVAPIRRQFLPASNTPTNI